MIIELCTITGADDQTDPKDLFALSLEFPFVEWGILIGNTNGKFRFPSWNWIVEFTRAANALEHTLNVSAHLCGDSVRHIMRGKYDANTAAIVANPQFDRMQLNTHGVNHDYTVRGLEVLLEELPIGIIVQMDHVNAEFLKACRDHRDLKHDQIDAIFDLSHGAGLPPPAWEPPVPGVFCTYAGGLGPKNLEEELKKINLLVPADQGIAIDMETHVRTDERLDLEKVRACLEIASHYAVRF